MVEILAIRDNETGTVVELRELDANEDVAKLYAERRKRFMPPRYDLTIGMAASLDDFLKSYPRYRRGGRGEGAGDGKGTEAGKGQRDGGAAGAVDGNRPNGAGGPQRPS